MTSPSSTQRRMRLVSAGIWAFALPLIWYFSTPRPENSWQAADQTTEQLERMRSFVESFRKKYGRLPTHTGEIRLYALSRGRSFSPYDGYGRLIRYETLSRDHYILKSFGQDGTENTAHSQPDQILTSLPTPAQLPPTYREPQKDFARLYPAVLLMGAKSPKSDHVAELMVDYDGQGRHLVVRDLKRPGFMLDAHHPGVEEFLWLPNGYEIIYTATNQLRYNDGIFIWNILTNQFRNLLGDLQKSIKLTDSQAPGHYFLSLAGIDPQGTNAYVFAAPDLDRPLPPEAFYDDANLYRMSLPRRLDAPVTFESMRGKTRGVFARIPQPADDIYQPFLGSEAQTDWARLPTEGPLQPVLERWQEFSFQHAKTPAFPYALWWLSCIYADAWETLRSTSPAEARTLRAYGAELARALAKLSMAPTYLRAMGAALHHRLMTQERLPYRISRLENDMPKNPAKPRKP